MNVQSELLSSVIAVFEYCWRVRVIPYYVTTHPPAIQKQNMRLFHRQVVQVYAHSRTFPTKLPKLIKTSIQANFGCIFAFQILILGARKCVGSCIVPPPPPPPPLIFSPTNSIYLPALRHVVALTPTRDTGEFLLLFCM